MAKQHVLVDGICKVLKEGVKYEEFKEKMTTAGRQVMKCKAPPSMKTMEKWMMDGIARTTDGCKTEPDGSCVHGHKSWLLVMHLI